MSQQPPTKLRYDFVIKQYGYGEWTIDKIEMSPGHYRYQYSNPRTGAFGFEDDIGLVLMNIHNSESEEKHRNNKRIGRANDQTQG